MHSLRKGKKTYEILAEDVQCEKEFSQANLSHKAENSQKSKPSGSVSTSQSREGELRAGLDLLEVLRTHPRWESRAHRDTTVLGWSFQHFPGTSGGSKLSPQPPAQSSSIWEGSRIWNKFCGTPRPGWMELWSNLG